MLVRGELRLHRRGGAFLDHRPVFNGNTLVTPREHIVIVPERPAELLTLVLAGTRRIAAALAEG